MKSNALERTLLEMMYIETAERSWTAMVSLGASERGKWE